MADLLIMDMNRMMQYAFLTFFLLPPPCIIPVFLGKGLAKESDFYTNLLVLYTIVTLVLYAAAVMVLGQ